ncbi:lysophospholipid acyltransferase family protein [Parvibium lacunae]|uniref:1-acyl-sn-glycerol-3-phosphate acyltransferase n=1 Tax=Parvibium lacunae TaxID=1888893 RepID=A0A368L4L6_9BURK|nr:lysophospholipid acyltransferase family protein [Parvibium lacunae]RCS58519.1 1-acyl-sn-glycerol-3-phosphate acyltransferase [Parvibium lacunae]
MRIFLRRLSGLTQLLGLLMLGLFLVTFGFPLLPESARLSLVRWWSRHILRIFSIRLQVNHPEALPPGGALLVLNHISWIDIYVLNSFRPVYFIAKADIARWPVIGYLCARTGTIFIERGKRHAVRAVNEKTRHLLQQGARIACFPEGTTTNGMHLLPFHANLLQPALDAGVPLVPVALRYFNAQGQLAKAVDYSGQITMWQTMCAMWGAASQGGLTARLDVLPPFASASSRHELAHAAQEAIVAQTGFVVHEPTKPHA